MEQSSTVSAPLCEELTLDAIAVLLIKMNSTGDRLVVRM